ncbi:MAG TPA: hypothetical protein VHQ65_07235 [Thermoanaerobaculia bacterium]|nr:hypothetical protein [Thermoanaerobaculia bacterium]
MPLPEERRAALVADVAWLGDHLAWLGVYREAAILGPRDRQLTLLAAAAAGSLVEPLGALSLHAPPPPEDWNEEEALRQSSKLLLPHRYREGLEWMASLAYRTGIYYEPRVIAPAELVPCLLEAAAEEALVLARTAARLAEEGGARCAGTAWTLRNLAEALQLVGEASPALFGRRFPRWRRRPAVAGRRA